jgi:hypothetical protein
MVNFPFSRNLLIAIFACLMSAQFAGAQQYMPSPASTGAALLRKAKIAYLSDVGPDAGSLVAFFSVARNKADMPYQRFVSAMKAWGRSDLSSAPGDSDVVMEFRIESALSDTGKLTTYSTFLSVSIVDAKTHFVVSTIKTPIQVSKSFDQNVDVSVARTMDALQALSTPAIPVNGER